MVCPDIAFQLTNDLIFPAHAIRSFLFLLFYHQDCRVSTLNVTGRPLGRPVRICYSCAFFSCFARRMVTSAQRWAAILSKVG